MNKEQAVNYLRFSGFSDEQIKAIEGAFTCDKCVYSTNEGCQYGDITETIPPFEQESKTDWIVPIILIDKKGEEHDGLMDMRRMLIYLHNIPAETAISLGYTWKLAESEVQS